MRRPVLAAMTGLTAVVVGLGIRAGTSPGGSTKAAVVSVGVLATTASPTATSKSTKVNGTAAGTRYGPLQVQITVKNGKITAADAIVYPTQERRDQEINSYAIPQLDSEAVQAQSAQIDSVSGATVTSEGYVTSLQSAIDQARSAGLL